MKIKVFSWLILSTLYFLTFSQSILTMDKEQPTEALSLSTQMETALKNHNAAAFNASIQRFRANLQNRDLKEQQAICTTFKNCTKSRIVKSKIAFIASRIDTLEKRYYRKSKNNTVHETLQAAYLSTINTSAITTNPETGNHVHNPMNNALSKQPTSSKKTTENATKTTVKMYDHQLFSGHTTGTIEIYTYNKPDFYSIERKNGSVCIGHTDAISAFDIYNKKFLISGSIDETVKVWDINQRKCLTTVRPAGILDDRGDITALAIGCKKLLLAGTLDGALHILENKNNDFYDAPHYVKTNQIKAHDDKITAMGTINEIGYISGSLDSTSKIWDRETIQHIQTQKHSGKVTSIEVGDKCFINLINNNTLEIWNTEQRSPLHTFQENDFITAITIDDTHIALGLDTGTIKIIDLKYPSISDSIKVSDSALQTISLHHNKLKAFTAENSFIEIEL